MEARITDWTKFREQRAGRPSSEIDDVDTWAEVLRADIMATTQKVYTTTKAPNVDTKLLHLWEARRSLVKRWKRQKLNRKLKLRIANLTEEAARYAAELCKQNWLELCDGLSGTLGASNTWRLLRYLIDPTKSKGETTKTMNIILHKFQGTKDDLLKALQQRYLPAFPPYGAPDYTGVPNQHLDRELEVAEVRAALAKIRRNTTPGQDQITNKMLANLDNDSTPLSHNS